MTGRTSGPRLTREFSEFMSETSFRFSFARPNENRPANGYRARGTSRAKVAVTLDINYAISATECNSCKKSVLVPADDKSPHCYFCGRSVPRPDPTRYSNVNASMQRLVAFIKESGAFESQNTNTAVARAVWPVLGPYLIDALAANEASIRYGYYGKPNEFEAKLAERTRRFAADLEGALKKAAAGQSA